MSRRFTPTITVGGVSYPQAERTLIAAPLLAPTLVSATPSTAPIGTTLTFVGTNFVAGMTVQFTGALVPVAATSIVTGSANVVVPPNTTSGPVTVTTSNGTSNALTFTVGALPVGAPVFAGMSPSQAPVGSPLSLIFTNGIPGMTVQFAGGVSAPATNITGNNAFVVVPVGAQSGAMTLTTSNGVSNPQTFTVGPLQTFGYLAPTPGYLAPIDAMTGATMTFNATTGRMNGTAVNTTQPTWAFTDPLTDTGNVVTNFNNLQAKIDTHAASMTGNTAITYPPGFRTRGRLMLRTNTTGFYVGIVPANPTNLPPLADGTSYGSVTNRCRTLTHWQAQWTHEMPGGVQDGVICESGDVRRYYIRAPRWDNTGKRLALAMCRIGPQDSGIATQPTSNTASSFVFPNGTNLTDLANVYLMVFRGGMPFQLLRTTSISNNGGTAPALNFAGQTVQGTWSAATRIRQYPSHGIVGLTPSRLFPEDVIIVQASSDGGGPDEQSLGGVIGTVVLNGRRLAYCDGYTRESGRLGQDSTDCAMGIGEGPYKYSNCSSEINDGYNWLVGGLELPGDGDELLPTNIEIRGNECRGIVNPAYSRECSLEVKFGRRGLIDSNYFPSQPGMQMSFRAHIVIKLTDQGGSNPGTTTQHWLVRNNRSDTADATAGCVYVSGRESTFNNTNVTNFIDVKNNASRSEVNGFLAGGNMLDIVFEFNTSLVSPTVFGPFAFNWITATSSEYIPGNRYTNRYNVWATPEETGFAFAFWEGGGARLKYPDATNTTGPNVLTIANTAPNQIQYAGQLLTNGGWASIPLINPATNWRLASGAFGRNAAPGGHDFGANIDLLTALTDPVRS